MVDMECDGHGQVTLVTLVIFSGTFFRIMSLDIVVKVSENIHTRGSDTDWAKFPWRTYRVEVDGRHVEHVLNAKISGGHIEYYINA
jgi:hypothetical protein